MTACVRKESSQASCNAASASGARRCSAKKIAEELRERGVRAVDVEAMGSELPVASNDTDSVREKNRRVEVWLR